jgi:predicted secreted protein
MRGRWGVAALLAAGLAALQGCAGVGLTLFGVGAGITGGTGVNYTLDSIAYKTFATSEEELRAATVKTLKRMAMDVTENHATESGRQIMAQAGERTVDIELDRITSRTSRMRVVVKQGWFFRDRATAGEIIVQTDRTLDSAPVVTKGSQ